MLRLYKKQGQLLELLITQTRHPKSVADGRRESTSRPAYAKVTQLFNKQKNTLKWAENRKATILYFYRLELSGHTTSNLAQNGNFFILSSHFCGHFLLL